jgi:hypothetical protein
MPQNMSCTCNAIGPFTYMHQPQGSISGNRLEILIILPAQELDKVLYSQIRIIPIKGFPA